MPRTIASSLHPVRKGRPESPYIADAEAAMNFIATADDTVRLLTERANQHLAISAELRRLALRLGLSRRAMTDSARERIA